MDKSKSLFITIMNETGGLYDPRIIIKFISILKEWLPEVERSKLTTDEFTKAYNSGYNGYKAQILENLGLTQNE